MTEIPSNIWQVPVYLPYLQPSLTTEAIADAEDRLGLKLPHSYLVLLRQQNGGYVRLRLPESVHSEIWGIGPYFPNIAKGHPWREPDAAKELGVWLPDNPRSLVPFDGDGHWYLCLDYRNGTAAGEPRVTYLDLECEREEAIAPDFVTFLSMLREKIEPGTWGIVDDRPLEEVLQAIESLLTTKFGQPNSSDHGYPQYRCSLGTKNNPQWLWLSLNEVPRGFIRPSDRRYVELVDLLPGTGLRMPNRPEVKIIVTSTDGVADRVGRMLMQSALAVKHIEPA